MKMKVYRKADGSLGSSILWDSSSDDDDDVASQYCGFTILENTKRHRLGVHEVLYNVRLATSKLYVSGGIFSH